MQSWIRCVKFREQNWRSQLKSLEQNNFSDDDSTGRLLIQNSPVNFSELNRPSISGTYKTFQELGQSTVRVIPIDGLNPDSPAYPYTRQLYYADKNPARTEIQQFMSYVTSPEGPQALVR